MLMSVTGAIEEIESSLGRFMPPLKVSEPRRTTYASTTSTQNVSKSEHAGSPEKQQAIQKG